MRSSTGRARRRSTRRGSRSACSGAHSRRPTRLPSVAQDDWRVRVELGEEHVWSLLDRLGLDLGSDAHELAKELEEHRLAVTHDADTVFVYTASGLQAEHARKIVESELAELGIQPRSVTVEHWLPEQDRW